MKKLFLLLVVLVLTAITLCACSCSKSDKAIEEYCEENDYTLLCKTKKEGKFVDVIQGYEKTYTDVYLVAYNKTNKLLIIYVNDGEIISVSVNS